ncbi:MAG: KDO2-lipid IV(A) lauroyltransferase [Pseudohongiellaceae bacterium]|jgi:KDO2-lipid IV(A) lauroyltransferase
MTESRNTFRNRLEWLLVCALAGPVLLMPRRPALWAMRCFGDLSYVLLVSRRRRASELVQEHLGVDKRRARTIVRGAFRTMALNLIEPLLLHRQLKTKSLDALVTVEGIEHALALKEQGKGMLLATAHLGAWECLAHVCRLCLAPVWAVARPLDNPLLEKLVVQYRLGGLAGTLEKDGSGLRMARLFRKGEIVILVLDQNAGRKSVLMDFLGTPSRQHKVSGAMAVRFGVPVLPTYLLREPDGLRYRFVIEPAIEPDPSLEGEEAERDVVRRVSESLEARVQSTPEQWLWLHDRWRSARHTAMVEQLALGQAGEAQAAKRGNVAVQEGTNEG